MQQGANFFERLLYLQHPPLKKELVNWTQKQSSGLRKPQQFLGPFA